MRLLRSFSVALHSMWDYKGRTFLALLGMLVSSLLLAFLLALLHNFQLSVEGQVQSFGLRQIVAMPGRVLNRKVGQFDLSTLLSITTLNSTLTYQDAVNVQKRVPGVVAAVPQTEIVSSAHYGQKSTEILYTGTTPEFDKVFRLTMAEGRWLDQADMKQMAQSVVLGAWTKQTLFGKANAIGKTVVIKGVPFRVVGVLAPKELIGFNFDQRAYTEYPLVIDTTSLHYASMIFFTVGNHASIDAVSSQIDGVISSDHHGTKNYMLVRANEALHLVAILMKLVTAVTVGIAAVSFLVSGIGIMNVMLLVVNERTREIGLRKAVGAKSYQVLFQFLAEALVISLAGAGVGLGASFGLLKLLGHYFPALSTQMPGYVIEYSLVFSIVTGLVFGLAPAVKAVRIQPADALRYE